MSLKRKQIKPKKLFNIEIKNKRKINEIINARNKVLLFTEDEKIIANTYNEINFIEEPLDLSGRCNIINENKYANNNQEEILDLSFKFNSINNDKLNMNESNNKNNIIEDDLNYLNNSDEPLDLSINKNINKKDSSNKLKSENGNNNNRLNNISNPLIILSRSNNLSIINNANNNHAIKMVRGQDEWINNSRNNFISQILKCLICSKSFNTLHDLSMHMLNTKHFKKFNSSKACSESITKKENNPNENSINTIPTNNKIQYNYDFSKKSKSIVAASKVPTKSHLNCNVISNKTTGVVLCLICKNKFTNGSYLIEHLQNDHAISQICTSCGSYFETFSDYHQHLINEDYHYNSHYKHSNQLLTHKKLLMTYDDKIKLFNAKLNLKSSTINNNGMHESLARLKRSVNIPLYNIDRYKKFKKCQNSEFFSNELSQNNSSNNNKIEKEIDESNKLANKKDDLKNNDVPKNPLLALELFVYNKINLNESKIDSSESKLIIIENGNSNKQSIIENPLHLLQKMHSNFSSYVF